MKKIITLTILTAASAMFFGCSPKQNAAKLTIQDAANAAPENASVFAAFDMDKNLQSKFWSQKGAKEWQTAYINSEFAQSFFDKINQGLPEELKPILTKEFLASASLSMAENPEDIFAAAAFISAKKELKCGYVIFKCSIAAQKAKEIFEQKKFEKSQNAGFEFFKPNAELVVAIKGDMIIVADNEAEAKRVFANLKNPQEKSFAKTPQFEKLISLKKNPNFALFADGANLEKDFGSAFLAMEFSASDYSATLKLGLNDGIFGDENVKKAWIGFCKNKLAKSAILKNSMQNSSIALALAMPEISQDMGIPEIGEEGKMALAMLQKIGLKSLYFSCGEIDVEALSKIQETMQPPEAFLKLDCQNTDAFFKDETMAQLLNSPFVAPMQIGENTIYATMANLKIAQISKESAIISTITDMGKMMSLAKCEGESLANNKDVAALFEKLPSGNSLEMFIDAKYLQKISADINSKNIVSAADGELPADKKEALQLEISLQKLQAISAQMTKKSVCALGVKLEEKEISAEIFGEFEYDYDLGVKLLKEAK